MAKFEGGCSSRINNAKEVATETVVKEVVEKEEKENSGMIKVGYPAPDFELQAYHKGDFTKVKLSDFKGKWVLLCFYPGDFTFVWATEVSAVAAKYEDFKKLDAEILSVSVDSQFVHKVWNDNELNKMVDGGIPYPMLADQGGKVGTLYGVYDENASVEMRGRFIIDPDGIVQGYELLTPPVGRNVEESFRQLKAFQLVRKTKGAEVTPSGWQEGGITLKPSNDLVGNVWKEWTTKDLK